MGTEDGGASGRTIEMRSLRSVPEDIGETSVLFTVPPEIHLRDAMANGLLSSGLWFGSHQERPEVK